MRSYDHVIVGAGSVGSQIFHHLAASHAGSVLALEQFTPAYSRTAVGGDTRLFRLAYAEGLDYQPILNEALVQWNALNEASGRSVYERTGCHYIGPADSDYMTSLRENTAAAGIDCISLDAGEFSREHPQHRLSPDDTILHDPAGGFLRTDLAVQTAMDLGRAHGGEVEQCRRILRISRFASGGFVLSTDHEAFHAGDVIIAAGAWSAPLLSQPLADLVEVRRIALTWFGTARPDLFSPSAFPVFKRVTPGIDLYGAPSVDGTQIKVTLAESWPAASADSIAQSLQADERDRVTRAVDAGLNFVSPGIVRCDAFPELFTADHVPLIGRDPDTGAYLALGFSGKGFKMSAGIGSLVAREVLAPGSAPLAFASPQRFLSAAVEVPVGLRPASHQTYSQRHHKHEGEP
ncbi:FAD-dependent oxidoreductase [Streptomyces chartreusis]|uniref:FAD-dependent oxidoreductase n=1 Tax=Streptomyces chartreusis TaxID=1969 RepID=UPI003652E00C